MPGLSNKEAHQFWHDYPDPIVYKVISFMESVENWTHDSNAELENTLTELGNVLDNIGNIDLQEEEKIIQLTTCLKMGRSLRLLQYLDLAHPGAASKILLFAENDQKTKDFYSLFLRRNLVFERLRLLNRIFSTERLTTIAKVLNNKG